jgi:hypothetical protein
MLWAMLDLTKDASVRQKSQKTNGAYLVIVTVNPDINAVDMCTSLLGHMQENQGKERDLMTGRIGVTRLRSKSLFTPRQFWFVH